MLDEKASEIIGDKDDAEDEASEDDKLASTMLTVELAAVEDSVTRLEDISDETLSCTVVDDTCLGGVKLDNGGRGLCVVTSVLARTEDAEVGKEFKYSERRPADRVVDCVGELR